MPGNVYGHKQEAASIVLDGEEIQNLIRTGARVVDLSVDGKQEKALVKDVQWDTFTSHVLHIDFLRVDPDERVQVNVPLQLKGTAPGVTAGGILEMPHHTVEVECLAVEVPDHIVVKIGSLNIGDIIHVSDLQELPTGVKVVMQPETVLIHVVEPRVAPEPTAEEGAPAEPALVTPAGKDKEEAEA